MDVRLYFYYEHSLTQSLCEGQSRLTRVLGGLAFLATWLCGLFWLVSAVKAFTATGGQTEVEDKEVDDVVDNLVDLFNLVAAVFSVFTRIISLSSTIKAQIAGRLLATCAYMVEKREMIRVLVCWLVGMFAAMFWWWADVALCFNISQCN
jgi:hypothetical protein